VLETRPWGSSHLSTVCTQQQGTRRSVPRGTWPCDLYVPGLCSALPKAWGTVPRPPQGLGTVPRPPRLGDCISPTLIRLRAEASISARTLGVQTFARAVHSRPAMVAALPGRTRAQGQCPRSKAKDEGALARVAGSQCRARTGRYHRWAFDRCRREILVEYQDDAEVYDLLEAALNRIQAALGI
jgi:hypothetical protein